MSKEETSEKKLYCPICRGPVEETGRPTWAHCPVHGWVKYKSYDEQEDSDLLSKINLRATILAKQAEKKFYDIRNKSPLLGYIVPALFITVIVGFLIGYFVWRGESNKSPMVKEIVTQDRKGVQPTIQPQAHVSPHVSPKELVAVNEKKEDTRKVKEVKQDKQTTQNKQVTQKEGEPLQPQKPFKPLFTVQAGVFQNLSHATNLKKMLHKKGYDVSMVTLKSDKGVTLYKVRIGKFKDRKSAEDVAKKIRTKEDIQQAFVTVE